MGLFDFLKPKKNPMADLLQKSGVRSTMAGMELEYLQKQIANLRSVYLGVRLAIPTFGYCDASIVEPGRRTSLQR